MSLEVELFKAVMKGDAAKVKELLEKGVNANVLDSSLSTLMDISVKGRTPLHIAAEKGCADIVKLLLNHGADVNAG
ncbi:MAG: ankyrin repeat domain-containing protein [Thermofilum sp.]|jgi:ankyrin repeat protein|nr:ankyrin repeat domain-containing protein [Thermofilum sp.]